MDPDPTPRQRPGLTQNLTGHELFIYDASGQELTVLNRSALMIWSLCDGTHTLPQMLDVLSDIYSDVEPGDLEKDVNRCLDAFTEKGLIERDPPRLAEKR